MALWVLAQAVRGWRGIQLGHYRANIAATRILLSGSHNIYSLPAQQTAANEYFQTRLSDIEQFVHPPQVAWILIPLARMDPRVGYAVFLAFLVACLLAAGVLLYRYVLPRQLGAPARTIVVGATVFSSVVGWAFWWGEWDTALLLAATAALVLAQRGKSLQSGLLLSLLLVKPNLVWLLPIVLIGARQWRMTLGFVIGGSAWIVSVGLILGFNNLGAWPAASAGVWEAVLASVSITGTVAFIFSSQLVAFILTIIFALIAIGASWRYGKQLSTQPDVAIAIGLAASLLTTPYIFEYDLTLLVLPLCVWARSNVKAALAVTVGLSVAHLLVTVGLDWHWDVLAPLATLAGLALVERKHAPVIASPA